MKTIWKFPVFGPRRYTTRMPAGAEILSVQEQGDDVQMWALVDPSQPDEPRTFQGFGTGHPVDAVIVKYLDTLQFDGGDLIFHFFEVEPGKGGA
jgi:hypothetical protein